MQLSDARTILSGWLQDTGSVQWSAARLNELIRLALRETEKHVLSFDPDAIKATYTASTTVPTTGKDNIYSYPAGTFAVHEIALSSDGLNYTPLPRRSLPIIREHMQNGYGSESCFVPYDTGHFLLFPSPTAVVVSGLRVIVAPTLTMTDDTDPFPLPLAFETMVLRQAQVFALWDVGEPTDTIQREVDKLKAETPRFYLTNDQPPVITPMISRGY
jgi:hypothetical protein